MRVLQYGIVESYFIRLKTTTATTSCIGYIFMYDIYLWYEILYAIIGIMEEDIKDMTNILNIQVKLLTIFSDKMILVSHNVDSKLI